ncbi:MAG: flagellar filament capping protein FliD [Defluviitaleaceae bacterium]|nr:flagellar filament capping protein FliD [Defluviitaleaceae bacterium]MCL2275696.1 flagellar filament capping protein FliD [Defluviitaleaceae bacterium]
MFGNQIRFTGMSSGMDTQTIVTQLMRAESMRMDRLTRRRQLATWRQEQFRGFATTMQTFRQEQLQVGTTGNWNVARTSSFRAIDTTVTPQGSATAGGINVTSTSDARPGQFTVRVGQQAQNASVWGHQQTGVTGSSTLTSMGRFTPAPPAANPNTGAPSIVTNSRTPNISLTQAREAGWTLTHQGWSSVTGGGVRTTVEAVAGSGALFEGAQVQAATIRVGNQNREVYFANVGGTQYQLQRTDTGFERMLVDPEDNASGYRTLNIMVGANNASPVTVPRNEYFEYGTNFEQIRTFDDGGNQRFFINTAGGAMELWRNANGTFTSQDPTDGAPVGTTIIDESDPAIADAVANASFFQGEAPLTFRNGNQDLQVQSFNHNGTDIMFVTINGVNRELTGTPGNLTLTPLADNPSIINESAVRDVHTEYRHTQHFVEAPTNVIRTGSSAPLNTTNPPGMPWANWGDNPPDGWRAVDANGNLFTTTTTQNATYDGHQVMQFRAGGQTIHFVNIDDTAFVVERNLATGVFERVTHEDFFGAGTPNPNDTPWAVVAPQGAVSNTVDHIHTQRFQSTITINGANINIYSNFTANDIMNAINRSGAGVDMRLQDGVFSLTARNSGASINITNDEAGFMAMALGLDGNLEAGVDRSREGQNATIYIYSDASSEPRRLESTAARPGVFTYNHHTISIANAAVGDEFVINTTRNTEQAVERAMEAVQNFVEQYNALVLMLQNAHSTNRPRTTSGGQRSFFEPLTDAERRDMSDREIERWEEQAQKGLLHRDSTLRNIQAQMRRQMSEGVLLEDGSRVFLHQLGITSDGTVPGQAGSRNMGLLRIDEERLKSVLNSQPELVEGMFAQRPLNTAGMSASEVRDRTGLAHRLGDLLHSFSNPANDNAALTRMAGNDRWQQDRLSLQIRTYDRRMDRMQDFLIRRENQLFRQFSMMEQAMSRSHSQMDALFMFGGG